MSRRRRTFLALAALGAVSVIGCSPPALATFAPLPRGPEALGVWRRARAEIEALRAGARSTRPYKMDVALEVTHPLTGSTLRARGAIAVAQPSALRMILLGPGGTTALDVWICRDDYRLLLPAADVEVRGSLRDEPLSLRGLPVGFLSWWFLRPFEGTLLAYAREPLGERFLMREGRAVVDVRRGEAALSLERRSSVDRERLASDGARCGHVRYEQEASGLALSAHCLALDPEAEVPEAAFVDPDDPERACLEAGAP